MSAPGGRTLVINEWLLDDLAGDNGGRAREEAIEFLRALAVSTDILAVAWHSAWIEKAHRKISRSNDPGLRVIHRLLFGRILRNLDKTKLIAEDELRPLPSDVSVHIPTEDHYLARTYVTAEADLLVTTDETLFAALTDEEFFDGIAELGVFKAVMREDFLDSYLGQD